MGVGVGVGVGWSGAAAIGVELSSLGGAPTAQGHHSAAIQNTPMWWCRIQGSSYISSTIL